MKINKVQREQLCFIQNNIKEIKKDILNTLLAIIQEKKEYYYQKQKQFYKSAIKKIVILVLLTLGFYQSYNCFSLKYHHITQLIKELEPYGITVKQHSKNHFSYREYWLETVRLEGAKDLIHYQEWVKAKKILDQIYELHATIYSIKIEILRMLLRTSIICYIIILLKMIPEWLNLRYKEYYEKCSILEDQIEQKIADLS